MKETIYIIKECKDAKRIGIGGHIRPDGDCVGSCLALWQYIGKMLPEAEVKVYLQKPADIFAPLKGFDQIHSDFGTEEVFDVFFALDCNEERLGDAQPYFKQAKKRINIDHHISNANGCGDLNDIRPEVGSTAELIYELICEEGNENMLDTELAKAIYTGIIHDTGVFQYSNTRPRTMEIGAKLISYGFDFTKLIEETFYQKTYKQTLVLGHVVSNCDLLLEGSCGAGYITKAQMEEYHVGHQDLDGIVNQIRNIKGVHCAIFMYEMEDKVYKVSLRSDELVDVAKVASGFGGGGHMRAAGCTMEGTYQECLERLITQISAQIG